MPSYSFVCGCCGGRKTELMPVSVYMGGTRPLCCGAAMEREYCPAQVVRDFYTVDREVPALNSLDDDVMKDPPLFGSRTEERAYRAEHQRIFGWGMDS